MRFVVSSCSMLVQFPQNTSRVLVSKSHLFVCLSPLQLWLSLYTTSCPVSHFLPQKKLWNLFYFYLWQFGLSYRHSKSSAFVLLWALMNWACLKRCGTGGKGRNSKELPSLVCRIWALYSDFPCRQSSKLQQDTSGGSSPTSPFFVLNTQTVWAAINVCS